MIKARVLSAVVLLFSLTVNPASAQDQPRLVYGNLTLSNVQIAATPVTPGGAAGWTHGQFYDVEMTSMLAKGLEFPLYDDAHWFNAFPAVTRLSHSNGFASGEIADLSGTSAYVDAFLTGPGEWDFAASAATLRSPLLVTPHTTITITGNISANVSGHTADGDSDYYFFLILAGQFPNGTDTTIMQDQIYRLENSENIDQPFSLALTNNTGETREMLWTFQGRVTASLVPEPASYALLGAGLMVLGVSARRRTVSS